ncbi:hypothetical protein [Bacillus thuringiensis]|uniref:hypothetical protein n=1 Tax=Bacillus thuringiensis TaxID=1428 RepID=UPI002FBE348B
MNKILQLTLLITALFILSSCSNDSIKDDIYENDSYLNTDSINDEDKEDDDSGNNTSSEYDIDISGENNNSEYNTKSSSSNGCPELLNNDECKEYNKWDSYYKNNPDKIKEDGEKMLEEALYR